MEFRFVPLDDLNTAKRRVVKRMIKNAKTEPRYALTTDQAIVYDEYLKDLIDLNDKLYNLQLQIESETSPAFRGIFTDLTGLLSKTKQLNTTDYSSRELSDLEEQRDNLQQRFTGIGENTTELKIKIERETRLINQEKARLRNQLVQEGLISRGRPTVGKAKLDELDRKNRLISQVAQLDKRDDPLDKLRNSDFKKIVLKMMEEVKNLTDLLTLKLEQPRMSGSGISSRFLTPVHIM
tara:strand:- start:2275 stop:2985 length:711 start_codon:yes stop_codon:yes gene_type:complete